MSLLICIPKLKKQKTKKKQVETRQNNLFLLIACVFSIGFHSVLVKENMCSQCRFCPL